jgi:hypothetical protein
MNDIEQWVPGPWPGWSNDPTSLGGAFLMQPQPGSAQADGAVAQLRRLLASPSSGSPAFNAGQPDPFHVLTGMLRGSGQAHGTSAVTPSLFSPFAVPVQPGSNFMSQSDFRAPSGISGRWSPDPGSPARTMPLGSMESSSGGAVRGVSTPLAQAQDGEPQIFVPTPSEMKPVDVPIIEGYLRKMDTPLNRVRRLFDSDFDAPLRALEEFMEDYRNQRDRLLEEYLKENPGATKEDYFKGYDPTQRKIFVPAAPEPLG